MTRAKTCWADSVENEANLLVEAKCVAVCGHFDASHPSSSRVPSGIEHELSPNSALHPIRVDEKIFQLCALFADQHRREANNSIIYDSDANAILLNSKIGECKGVWMAQEVRSIAFVREGRLSKHVAQCWRVGGHCEADGNLDHRHRLPVRLWNVTTGAPDDRCVGCASAGMTPEHAFATARRLEAYDHEVVAHHRRGERV